MEASLIDFWAEAEQFAGQIPIQLLSGRFCRTDTKAEVTIDVPVDALADPGLVVHIGDIEYTIGNYLSGKSKKLYIDNIEIHLLSVCNIKLNTGCPVQQLNSAASFALILDAIAVIRPVCTNEEFIITTNGNILSMHSVDTFKIFRQITFKPNTKIMHVTLSSDQKLIAIRRKNCSIEVFESSTFKLVQRLTGQTPGCIRMMKFSPDNRTLFISAGSLIIWEFATGLITKINGRISVCNDICVSNSGLYAAVFDDEKNRIHVMDRSDTVHRTINIPPTTNSMCFTPIGNHFILGFMDGTVAQTEDDNGKLSAKTKIDDFPISRMYYVNTKLVCDTVVNIIIVDVATFSIDRKFPKEKSVICDQYVT